VEATTGRLGELIGKMGGKRARLEWAINFIQEDLQAAGPGRRADLRRELTVFTRAWDVSRDDEWTPEGVRFFSEEELEKTQLHFRAFLNELLDGGHVVLPYRGTLRIVYGAGIPGTVLKERPWIIRELNGGMPDLARLQLAELVGDEDMPLVRICGAPKARGHGERCGRLFVGRPNQVYCTALCQNRATTRAVRARRAERASRRRKNVPVNVPTTPPAQPKTTPPHSRAKRKTR